MYAVAANPNRNARTGTLTIAGRIVTVTQAGVNDNLFEDDMENGTDGWWAGSCTLPERDDCSLDPYPWARTTASFHSGTQAWTDSPNGNYQNNVTSYIFSPQIDLTEVSSATLVFWHRYAFARGDEGIVRVQVEEGEREQTTIRRFTDTNSAWRQVSVDLSPFVGQSIRIIFHLLSDAAHTADGWYIDDVAVFSSDFDPLTPDPDLCQDYGPCSAGQGDCDPGQCGRGLVCVNDVGAQYGLPAHYDVCEAGPDPDYCQDEPCSIGEGDCDPGQCQAGLVCTNDVGAQYGLPAHYDVCEAGQPDSCRDFGPCSLIASLAGAQDSTLPGHLDLLEAAIYATKTDSQVILGFTVRAPIPEPDAGTLYSYRLYFDTDRPWWTDIDYDDEDFVWQIDIRAGGERMARGRGVTRLLNSDAGNRIALLADISELQGMPASIFAIAAEFNNGSWVQEDQVLPPTQLQLSAPNPDYCRDYGPCSAGQGDCDPEQCASGLVCTNDVGAQYGFPAHYDVCEVPSG